ncbi:MAG: fused MFS/spermidine synthase [Microthrixaceae bacterium]|nr:fused MFS/spermidine synthase [Microthrixaceae bacterium]
MRRPASISIAWLLAMIVALSGASALVLQVVWQRVISMNSGVDLTSTTTVVAGFLAGLGIGSLLGGRLADRLGPRRSLVAFALANAGIAVFAWFSIWLFYDLYGDLATGLDSRPATFAFNFVLLLVPTVLEGMSLPLVARIVSRQIEGSAALVGRLYGVNTLGAAFGAIAGGWYLMGEHGFLATTRAAAVANLVVAVSLTVVALVWRPGELDALAVPALAGDGSDAIGRPAGASGATEQAARQRVRRWYAAFAAFGAIALAFQHVFFRLLDAIARSNSYSFSLILAIYLGVWGLGAAIGAGLVRRTVDHRSWYLWLQFASGLVAAGALVLVVRIAPHVGLGSTYERWFDSDGFAPGYPEDQWGDIAMFALGAPAILMGVPVMLLGIAYPFAQAIVTQDLGRLGRTTGAVIASNIVGSVGGTLIAGFVLIDWFGTAGTFTLLCATLGLAGIAAIVPSVRGHRPPPGRITLVRRTGPIAVVALVALVALSPSNDELWAFIVGNRTESVDVAEDHSCGSVFELYGDDNIGLVLNGATQNGHPYDDFHILIGLLPALMNDRPDRTLAIGFGIGSTTHALLGDPRVGTATTVELCGGNYELARRQADRGVADFGRIFADPRSTLEQGDGRHHLLVESGRYDSIVIDTLRPTSANAGSHFSVEMYQLASDRLGDSGLFAEWAPSGRVLNAAASVFPYVVSGTVDQYNASVFFIGSRSPIEVDTAELLDRFDEIPAEWFTTEQRERLRRYIADWVPSCVTDGAVVSGVPSDDINTDLTPRDEYPLNNLSAPTEDETSHC